MRRRAASAVGVIAALGVSALGGVEASEALVPDDLGGEDVREDSMRPSGSGAGWASEASGMGMEAFDKGATVTFKGRALLGQRVCRDLYRHSGYAAKAIDIPVADMIKKGSSTAGLETDVASDLAGVVAALPVILPSGHRTRGYLAGWCAAQTWADVYGGSLLVMGLADGGDLEDELDEARLVALQWVKIYDRHQVTIQEWYGEEDGLLAGTPKIYHIWPRSTGGYRGAGFITVHASRCQVFLGVSLDAESAAGQDGWADSRYQRIWDKLTALGAGRANANSVLYELGMTVYKMSGLSGLLEAHGREKITHLFGMRNFFKSRFRAIVIDKVGEEVEFKSPSLTDVDKLLHIHMEDLAAVCDIPQSRFFGRQQSGIGSNGDGDLENYYSGLEGRRRLQMLPCLEEITRLILLSYDGPTGGVDPGGWSVVLPALWEMSAKEQAELDKLHADEVTVLVQQGVLVREEARSRLAGYGYSLDDEMYQAAQQSGSGELSVRDRILQIRLMYPTGALHLVEEVAKPLREMLGLGPWTSQARDEWLMHHGSKSEGEPNDEA